jgi:hypothetical protein
MANLPLDQGTVRTQLPERDLSRGASLGDSLVHDTAEAGAVGPKRDREAVAGSKTSAAALTSIDGKWSR